MARGDRVNWRTGVTVARGERVNSRTGVTKQNRTQGCTTGGALLLLLLAVRGGQAALEEGGHEKRAVTDFRIVPYESLIHSMDQFSETGVSHFSEILFDVKRHQLIVGARDTLFR
jgi:hypothetical protein